MKNFKVKWLLLSIILSVATIPQMWAAVLTQGQVLYADVHDCGTWYESSATDFRLWYGDGGSDYVDVEGSLEAGFLWYCTINRSDISKVQLKRVNPSNHSDVWNWSDIFNVESGKDVLKLGENCDGGCKWNTCTWYATNAIYATPSTISFDTHGSTTWNAATKTLKAKVKVGDNPDRYVERVMYPTGKSYDNEAIYYCKIYCLYSGVHTVDFEVYDGETYEAKKTFDKSSKSWSFSTCWSNIKDKIYDGSDWKAYHRDVIVYSIGSYFSTNTWDNSTSTLKIDMRRQGNDCDECDNGWNKYGNAYLNAEMTKTGYTYNGYDVYSYRFLELLDGGQCRFKHYVSGTWSEDYKAAWATADYMHEKIYKGYISSSHVWTAYATDIELDRQGGTTGDTRVTATIGETIPSATMPTRAGYSFGGYYTEENGGGTQYYAANGSIDKIRTKDGVKVLYAKWIPNTLTFQAKSTDKWDNTANWSEACLPTIEHDVVIDKPVVVNITNAKAKSVKIYNDGGDTHTGKLTIGAGMALVVAEDIQKTTDGSTYGQTTADVLHIEAGNTSDANGALVWGTSGTPGAAQVDFFTKSHGVKNEDTSINQYIGTPFSNDQSILYQYYYSWLFKIKRTDGVLSWDLMSGDDSMNEFEGYNLITAYDANTTYQMEGTLVSNGNVTLNGSSTTALVWSGSGDASNPNNENVLANSWVAPIKIAALTGFSNVESTIYIFNAGSEKQGSGGTGDTPGNYSTYSISEAGNAVIPSMQSFSVYATGENPSITLNYNTIVKSPLSSAYNNSANKAPAHNRADEMDLLKVRIDCENGWADELKIYIHEDFSNDFEDSWDAHKMYGYPEAPQLYAVTTDGNMAINCVPTADNNVLGFTPGSEDNEYTFSFTYDGDEEYYLKDTKLNIETLINTEATYTFTSEAEDSEMRFIIIKRAPAVATDAETVSGDRLAVSGVQKIMHNGQLYIIRDGEIYDATGTMVK